MAWDMSQYEPVAARLERFYAEHPTGRITTRILRGGAESAEWVVRAMAYRDVADARPAATGHAHEVVTQRGVNSTSALENCETSAIGRALANLGYAPKGGNRPSQEEMQKAARSTPANADDVEQMSPSAIANELRQRGLEPGGTVDAMRERLRVALNAGTDGTVGEHPPSVSAEQPHLAGVQ
jgi:hypothetical protein